MDKQTRFPFWKKDVRELFFASLCVCVFSVFFCVCRKGRLKRNCDTMKNKKNLFVSYQRMNLWCCRKKEQSSPVFFKLWGNLHKNKTQAVKWETKWRNGRNFPGWKKKSDLHFTMEWICCSARTSRICEVKISEYG
jgi:hypothetical protein